MPKRLAPEQDAEIEPDECVEAIRVKYALLRGPNSSAHQISPVLADPLRSGANQCLRAAQNTRRKSTRVLWFFMKGRRIVAVHGIRNKGQAIQARDIDTARARTRDWKERNAL